MAKNNMKDINEARAALVKEYRREARKADKRLLKLENLSYHDDRFEHVLEYSYKGAMRDIASWGGVQRFGQKLPTRITAKGDEVIDYRALQAKLADVKKFNQSATSTKQGIIDMYEKRQQTIEDQTGLSMTWEEAKRYYDEKINEKIDSKYGYITAKIAMGKIQQNADEIRDNIEAWRSEGIKTAYTSDIAMNDIINDLLESHWDDLVKIGVL